MPVSLPPAPRDGNLSVVVNVKIWVNKHTSFWLATQFIYLSVAVSVKSLAGVYILQNTMAREGIKIKFGEMGGKNKKKIEEKRPLKQWKKEK